MNTIWPRLLLLLFGFGISQLWSQSVPIDPTFQVMSYNIRLPKPLEGANGWKSRKPLIINLLNHYSPDIIGVQEAYRMQLDELMSGLSGYAWIGVCRMDGSDSPQPDNDFNPIIYKTDRFQVLESSTFSLSPTPDQFGVKAWDAVYPRIVTWAKMWDIETSQSFVIFNTHLDNKGKQSQIEGIRIIQEKIPLLSQGLPVLLTGDFNFREVDEPYCILTNSDHSPSLKDAIFHTQTPHYGPLATSTRNFQVAGHLGKRFDYIFFSKKISIYQHAILSDSWGGKFPSDHLPVLARIGIYSKK